MTRLAGILLAFVGVLALLTMPALAAVTAPTPRPVIPPPVGAPAGALMFVPAISDGTTWLPLGVALVPGVSCTVVAS